MPEAADRGARTRPAVARRLAEATGVRVAGVSYRGAVRHVFTHRDVTAELFRVDVAASGPAAAADHRWIAPGGLAALGVSSFARKTVALGARTIENIENRAKKPAGRKSKNGTRMGFSRSKEGW